MSRHVVAPRSYKTVFTLIKFQIKCNNANPPPPHTPHHPLTLLQYQAASFCLRLSLSLSLTLALSQQSSKIDNNPKQKKKTKQNKSSAAAAAILNKNANNTNNKSARLSAPSLSLSEALSALFPLYAFGLSHGPKLVLGAGVGVRACES